jgi:uncharacterized protein YkwD
MRSAQSGHHANSQMAITWLSGTQGALCNFFPLGARLALKLRSGQRKAFTVSCHVFGCLPLKPKNYATAALLGFLAAGCTHLRPPVASPAPDMAMALDRYDEAQLSRAIFDETNRVRVLHAEKPLTPDPGLDAAADEQAAYTALALQAGHTNPFPGEMNVAERVTHQNVDVAHVGENSIMMPALRPQGSNPPYYNYREFAAMLVEAWMNSPEHRENLLSDRFTELGCAARLGHGMRPGDFRIFAIQVFARPPSQGIEGGRSP